MPHDGRRDEMSLERRHRDEAGGRDERLCERRKGDQADYEQDDVHGERPEIGNVVEDEGEHRRHGDVRQACHIGDDGRPSPTATSITVTTVR